MARLLICTACSRHVRGDERDCPFCGYGPLRCTAPVPMRWALGASLVVGLGALAACDGGQRGDPEAPGNKTTAAPSPGTEQTSQGAEPAEPPSPEVDPPDIYGGPRMMDGEDPELKPASEADETGGETGEADEAGLGGEELDPPGRPAKRPMKYGAPRRDPPTEPKK